MLNVMASSLYYSCAIFTTFEEHIYYICISNLSNLMGLCLCVLLYSSFYCRAEGNWESVNCTIDTISIATLKIPLDDINITIYPLCSTDVFSEF